MHMDPVHPQLAWHFIPLGCSQPYSNGAAWARRQSALDLWLLVVLEALDVNALLFNRLGRTLECLLVLW
jgi:hypothetical protein